MVQKGLEDPVGELWYVYQQLQAGLRKGNQMALRETVARLVDRLGEQFLAYKSSKNG